eukprot:6213019-Pleurochrysis_carterae.AAC.4
MPRRHQDTAVSEGDSANRPAQYPGCICDHWAFINCPGHTRNGWRSIHAIHRPPMNSEEEVEHAKEALRRLRPNDNEENILKMTMRNSSWRAAASFHWRSLSPKILRKRNVSKLHLPDSIAFKDHASSERSDLLFLPRPRASSVESSTEASTLNADTKVAISSSTRSRDERDWDVGTITARRIQLSGGSEQAGASASYRVARDDASHREVHENNIAYVHHVSTCY